MVVSFTRFCGGGLAVSPVTRKGRDEGLVAGSWKTMKEEENMGLFGRF